MLAHQRNICDPPSASPALPVTRLCLVIDLRRASPRRAARVAAPVLSLPPSIFAEALKSVRRVATLYPVALPAQQDEVWRRVGQLKGWLLWQMSVNAPRILTVLNNVYQSGGRRADAGIRLWRFVLKP